MRRQDRYTEKLLLLQRVNKPQGLPPFLPNQLLRYGQTLQHQGQGWAQAGHCGWSRNAVRIAAKLRCGRQTGRVACDAIEDAKSVTSRLRTKAALGGETAERA
jgi:hypothetical protein